MLHYVVMSSGLFSQGEIREELLECSGLSCHWPGLSPAVLWGGGRIWAPGVWMLHVEVFAVLCQSAGCAAAQGSQRVFLDLLS